MNNKFFLQLSVMLLLPALLIAQSVTLKPLCNANFARGSSRFVQMNGTLYALDINNAVHKINLSSGTHSRLGKEWFPFSGYFFGVRNRLFIVEADGSMKQIDTATGVSQIVAPMNSFSEISRVVPLGQNLFTIRNGVLCHHPTLQLNKYKEIGEAEFFNVTVLLLADSSLHTVIGKTLYEIDTYTGKWKKICGDKGFSNYRTGAVIGNKLFTIENPAALFETGLPDGKRKQLDAAQFQKAWILFADSGSLYCLTTDYELFEVLVGAE